MAKIRLLCQSLFLMGLLLGLGAKVPNAAAPPTFTPVLPATPGPALAPAAEFIVLARPQQIPDTFDLVGENELFHSTPTRPPWPSKW